MNKFIDKRDVQLIRYQIKLILQTELNYYRIRTDKGKKKNKISTFKIR